MVNLRRKIYMGSLILINLCCFLLSSPQQVYNKCKKSVVVIYNSETGAMGTGVFIHDNFIITNWHVVSKASSVSVAEHSSKYYEIGQIPEEGWEELEVVAIDIERDLALIRSEKKVYERSKKAKLGKTYSIKIEPCQSQIGSGALPTEKIPSVALKISLKMKRGSGKSLNGLSKIFRELPKPVIGRIQDNAFWMDLRCLEKNHEDTFLKQLNKMIII